MIKYPLDAHNLEYYAIINYHYMHYSIQTTMEKKLGTSPTNIFDGFKKYLRTLSKKPRERLKSAVQFGKKYMDSIRPRKRLGRYGTNFKEWFVDNTCRRYLSPFKFGSNLADIILNIGKPPLSCPLKMVSHDNRREGFVGNFIISPKKTGEWIENNEKFMKNIGWRIKKA